MNFFQSPNPNPTVLACCDVFAGDIHTISALAIAVKMTRQKGVPATKPPRGSRLPRKGLCPGVPVNQTSRNLVMVYRWGDLAFDSKIFKFFFVIISHTQQYIFSNFLRGFKSWKTFWNGFFFSFRGALEPLPFRYVDLFLASFTAVGPFGVEKSLSPCTHFCYFLPTTLRLDRPAFFYFLFWEPCRGPGPQRRSGGCCRLAQSRRPHGRARVAFSSGFCFTKDITVCVLYMFENVDFWTFFVSCRFLIDWDSLEFTIKPHMYQPHFYYS